MSLTIFRKAHFNAAHRLFVKEWSDEKNREFFGKCSNPITMATTMNLKWV